MDHPFASRRSDMHALKTCADMCRDVATIVHISPEDYVHLLGRREPEIADDAVRRAVARCANGLGMVVDDINEIAAKQQLGVQVDSSAQRVWTEFVRGTIPASTQSIVVAVDCVEKAANAKRDSIAHLENDDGPSSSSDYSDEDDESTSSEDDGGDESYDSRHSRSRHSRRSSGHSNMTPSDLASEEEEKDARRKRKVAGGKKK